MRTHRNEKGNPTVSGFDGPTWSDNLHIDVDKDGDLEGAFAWHRAILDRLEAWDVDLGAVRSYFSGSKGTSLEIPHTQFGGFSPALDLHDRMKAAAIQIVDGIAAIDDSVYGRTKLWRLAGSQNEKSGLYKVPLTLLEARTATIDEIKALAAKPRDISAIHELTPIPDDEWMPNPVLVEIWQSTIAPARKQRTASVGATSRARSVGGSGSGEVASPGTPGLGVSTEVLDFLERGAAPGLQRTAAMKAIRSLLADGDDRDAVISQVFNALINSEQGKPEDPWTEEAVARIVDSFLNNPPPALAERAGGRHTGPWKVAAERMKTRRNGDEHGHAIGTNGTARDLAVDVDGADETADEGDDDSTLEEDTDGKVVPISAADRKKAQRAEKRKQERAERKALDTDEEYNQRPLEWLRGQRVFQRLGMALLDVRRTAGIRGKFELRFDPGTPHGETPFPRKITDDKGLRVVQVGSGGDILTLRIVSHTVAQELHVGLPWLTNEQWRPIGDAILRAATTVEVGISQEAETREWLGLFIDEPTAEKSIHKIDLSEADDLAEAMRKMKQMLDRDAAYTPDQVYAYFWGRKGDRGLYRLHLHAPNLTRLLTGPNYNIKVSQEELRNRLRALGFTANRMEAWVIEYARGVDGQIVDTLRRVKVKIHIWISPPGFDLDA